MHASPNKSNDRCLLHFFLCEMWNASMIFFVVYTLYCVVYSLCSILTHFVLFDRLPSQLIVFIFIFIFMHSNLVRWWNIIKTTTKKTDLNLNVYCINCRQHSQTDLHFSQINYYTSWIDVVNRYLPPNTPELWEYFVSIWINYVLFCIHKNFSHLQLIKKKKHPTFCILIMKLLVLLYQQL